MALTDRAVRFATARDRAYKLTDGRGLCLLVTPTGGKWWRYRYRIERVEKMLSLGTYPDVPLALARERCDQARRQVTQGVDPSAERKYDAQLVENSFEAVARQWLVILNRHVQDRKRSISTYNKAKWMLETFIFPSLGRRPISGIKPFELLAVLKKVEAKGQHETARRTKQRCGQIFRHAIGLGLAERDITVDIRGLLEPPIVEHHASITEPKSVGAMLRAIDRYAGRPVTRLALKLAPLVFVRPGELRKAQWEHIDFDKAEWRIPPNLMKMGSPHIVPLSKQALAVLKELKDYCGKSPYLFPALANEQRPMSENTVNLGLRRLGYSSDEMTGHGFRSMASTMLNELGDWSPDAIERQLAHGERNGVRAAYNYAEYLPERRRMMQAWADKLDSLRARPTS